jgi:hypothetical protein
VMRSRLERILQKFKSNASLIALKGYRNTLHHQYDFILTKDVAFREKQAGWACQAP